MIEVRTTKLTLRAGMTSVLLAVFVLLTEVAWAESPLEPWFGEWKLNGDSICPGICASSDEEARSHAGHSITLRRDVVQSGSETCRQPGYEIRHLHARQWLSAYRSDLTQFGFGSELVIVSLLCEGDARETWDTLGATFIIENKRHLHFIWDGRLFSASREH